MSDDEFRVIQKAIRDYCGLSYEPSTKFVMERRLRPRLAALGISSFRRYCMRVRFGADKENELGHAAEALVTNETYFFREAQQLSAFEHEVVPRLMKAKAGVRRLSVWSAGCSTGEEVYSLAMILTSLPELADWDLRVVGTDISREVLRHARRGCFRESSFRAMQPRFERYFRRGPDGREVVDSIRKLCSFARVNLVRPEQSAIIGTVDAVFCRNVLIYFDDPVKTAVCETLYDRLIPGGFLMLGHSESLFRGLTKFELVHLSSDLVYRRPDRIRLTLPTETDRS